MIKSYDHKILVIFMILFFSVFSAQDWNQPFINTDETLLLVEGMTKKQVLDEVGMPLLVHSGDDSTKTIKWIYEIRTIQVESENLYKFIQPRKSHPNYVHSQTIHRLELEFRDSQLSNWRINKEYNNFEKDIWDVTTEKEMKVIKTDVDPNPLNYLGYCILAVIVYLAIVL